eukprot:167470-Chlamydomonas_euryale.AAC.1
MSDGRLQQRDLHRQIGAVGGQAGAVSGRWRQAGAVAGRGRQAGAGGGSCGQVEAGGGSCGQGEAGGGRWRCNGDYCTLRVRLVNAQCLGCQDDHCDVLDVKRSATSNVWT